ncbi:hypothetical protein ACWDTI_16605 [Gordonia sp. NPDC003424]
MKPARRAQPRRLTKAARADDYDDAANSVRGILTSVAAGLAIWLVIVVIIVVVIWLLK